MVTHIEQQVAESRCQTCNNGCEINWPMINSWMHDMLVSISDIDEYSKMYGPHSGNVFCRVKESRVSNHDYCQEYQPKTEGHSWPETAADIVKAFPHLKVSV